jgi:pyruvate kinase
MPAHPPDWQRTKIVCTLGPATDASGVIEALVRSGMDVARINMSHGTNADHGQRIAHVRAVSRMLSRPIAILADLPGPKFRIGELPGGSRRLEDGATVVLAAGNERPEYLPLRQRRLLDALAPGESVYLADGSIELVVNARAAEGVACRVVVGGSVRSGSGVNAPQSELPGLVPTDEDRSHLAFAAAHGVDWIGVSFVQAPQDLDRVRAALPDGAAPLLMAKIEKRRALANLDAIVDAADGVMVARGDLGVETDLAEIPLAQKRIIAASNARARPVVTATQMLESMVEHEHPTRAEVTDIANAVIDGTDAVMLSAESAVGRHPAAAVKVLQRVLAATESHYAGQMAAARLGPAASLAAGEAVAFSACQLADRLGAKAIVARASGHRLATALARFRPAVPIIAVSPLPARCEGLAMVRGVSPLNAGGGETHTHLATARDWLFQHGLARAGERVVVVSATNDAGDGANLIQVAVLASP